MRGGLINVVCDLNSISSVVTLAYLAAIPGHLSEVNLNNFVLSVTRRVIS